MKKWTVVIGAAVAGWLAWLLFRKAPPVPPGQGTLDISVEPSSLQPDIYIDGVFAGRAPLLVNVDIGTRVVAFSEIMGYTIPSNISVEVIEGQTMAVIGIYTVVPGPVYLKVVNIPVLFDQVRPWTRIMAAYFIAGTIWSGQFEAYLEGQTGVALPVAEGQTYSLPISGLQGGMMSGFLLDGYGAANYFYIQSQWLDAGTLVKGATYVWDLTAGVVL